MIKELYLKYKEIFWYLVFGGLTTLVNVAIYYLCYNLICISNVTSNIIAWVVSVLFAFVTNKLFVFNKNAEKGLFQQILLFFTSRLGTGLLDLGIMYLTVDILEFNSLLMKIMSNIIVIILNYIFSKFFVFKQPDKETQKKPR